MEQKKLVPMQMPTLRSPAVSCPARGGGGGERGRGGAERAGRSGAEEGGGGAEEGGGGG